MLLPLRALPARPPPSTSPSLSLVRSVESNRPKRLPSSNLHRRAESVNQVKKTDGIKGAEFCLHAKGKRQKRIYGTNIVVYLTHCPHLLNLLWREQMSSAFSDPLRSFFPLSPSIVPSACGGRRPVTKRLSFSRRRPWRRRRRRTREPRRERPA